MRARQHHPAFHRREHQSRQALSVRTARQPLACGIEAGAHVSHPAVEIHRQQFTYRRVRFMQFQRQRPDGAAVRAVAAGQRAAVGRQQRKHAFDGIGGLLPGANQQHRFDAVAIALEHRQQDMLLGGKEVIQAAGMRIGRLQNVGIDGGGLITLGCKQLHRRRQDAVAGFIGGLHLIAHSSAIYRQLSKQSSQRVKDLDERSHRTIQALHGRVGRVDQVILIRRMRTRAMPQPQSHMPAN